MSWTRRLVVTAATAVAAAGIAVPLSHATPTASADPVVAAFQPASFAEKAPKALKDDLRAAWHAPDGQRVAALQAVLRKAVAGDYGAQVQQRAQRLQARLAGMNQQLRSDLQRAIDLPKDQRQAALREIRQKVQDGGYGDQVKRNAKLLRWVRHHRLFG